MRKAFRNLVLSILAVFMIFTVSSCSEEAGITINETKGLTYEEVKAKVDVFDEVYSNYFSNDKEEIKMISGEGYTPMGNTCTYTYVTNIDGINKADTVRSCTLEVIKDDGSGNVDEYFAVDATTLFIVRTTIPGDGSLGTVSKYACVSNELYAIDEKEGTLTPIPKPDTLDLYLSFSELTELYGKTN